MLAIRMQRTGRKRHAQFRVVVQEAQLTPTSGRVVARLGSYNPHTKTAVIDKEKIAFYLGNGAQPSERVARVMQAEGIKLPNWVKLSEEKKRDIRNPEKLRKNRPEEPAEEAKPEEAAEAAPAEEQPAATSEEKTPEAAQEEK